MQYQMCATVRHVLCQVMLYKSEIYAMVLFTLSTYQYKQIIRMSTLDWNKKGEDFSLESEFG
jgi:hypothetical protein